MKRSEIIMGIIALIIAVLVAFGVYFLLVIRPQTNEEKEKSKNQSIQHYVYQEIAVAKKTIYLGQPIGPDVLGYVSWPEEALSPNFYLRSNITDETFKEFVAQRSISEGEPITKTNIINTKNQGVLAALLKPGMRAVSISVDPASISSGLVVPGDIVDTIVTFTRTDSKGTEGAEILSKTVLCSIRVLALDQKTNDRPVDVDPKNPHQNNPPVMPRTATLEVTPSQAETLLMAAKTGVVFLSLHSTSMNHEANCVPSSLVNPKTPEKVVEKKVAAEPSIKIIRGSSAAVTEVKP